MIYKTYIFFNYIIKIIIHNDFKKLKYNGFFLYDILIIFPNILFLSNSTN